MTEPTELSIFVQAEGVRPTVEVEGEVRIRATSLCSEVCTLHPNPDAPSKSERIAWSLR